MTDRSALAVGEVRLPALDGVRGLAIVLVVTMHAALDFTVHLRLPTTGPLDSALLNTALLGWCGVDVFFVLSGFLITGILLRSKGRPHYFRDFYARRALRIFPLYYAVIVLLLFVMDRPPLALSEKVPYLLYYQNIAWAAWGESTKDLARSITWSLAIEEQFYLVWPTVVLLCSRRVLPWFCAATIAAAVLLRFSLIHKGVQDVYFLTPCRMDALAAGALLALVPAAPTWCGVLFAGLGIAGLAAVTVTTGLPLPTGNQTMQGWGTGAALLFAVGVLMIARAGGSMARLFENRVLRSFGRYSYCIYLVHLLVIEVCDRNLLVPRVRSWFADGPAALPVAAFAAICLAATWCVGLLSWHLFEKWFLALKRRFGG